MSPQSGETAQACFKWSMLASVPSLVLWLLLVRNGRRGLMGSLFPLAGGLLLGELQTNGSRTQLRNHKRGVGAGLLIALSGYHVAAGTGSFWKVLGFISLAALGWATPWTYWLFWLMEPMPEIENMGVLPLRKRAILHRLGMDDTAERMEQELKAAREKVRFAS